MSQFRMKLLTRQKKEEINLNKYFKEGEIYKVGLLIEVEFRIEFPGF